MKNWPFTTISATTGHEWAQQSRRMRIEQRTVVRYPLEIPVVFRWIEQGLIRESEGRTRDVSVRGAFVLADDCPPCRARVEIKMSFPAGSHRERVGWVEAKGSVLRVEPEWYSGAGGFAVESEDGRLFMT